MGINISKENIDFKKIQTYQLRYRVVEVKDYNENDEVVKD